MQRYDDIQSAFCIPCQADIIQTQIERFLQCSKPAVIVVSLARAQSAEVRIPAMIAQINKRAYVDPRTKCQPSILREDLRKACHNGTFASKLAQLKHQSPTAQFAGESSEHFPLTSAFDDGVKVIGTDYAAGDKFGEARHHASVLRRSYHERKNSDQFAAVAHGYNRQLPLR